MKIKHGLSIIDTKSGIALPKRNSMPLPYRTMLATMSGNSSPKSEMVALTKIGNLFDFTAGHKYSKIFHFPKNVSNSNQLNQKLTYLEENEAPK